MLVLVHPGSQTKKVNGEAMKRRKTLGSVSGVEDEDRTGQLWNIFLQDTNKVVDALGFGTSTGTNVHSFDDRGAFNQRWAFLDVR